MPSGRKDGKPICAGGYQPPGTDMHGRNSLYTLGCRCSRCTEAHTRYELGHRWRSGRSRPRLLTRAHRRWPGRLAVGGPWLLFLTILRAQARGEGRRDPVSGWYQPRREC